MPARELMQAMTERQLSEAIQQLALYLQWRDFSIIDTAVRVKRAVAGVTVLDRVVPAVRTSKGWPDHALTKDGRLIFAELKTMRGRLTSEQVEWLTALAQTAAEVYLWRPTHWHSGAIETVLRGQARQAEVDYGNWHAEGL